MRPPLHKKISVIIHGCRIRRASSTQISRVVCGERPFSDGPVRDCTHKYYSNTAKIMRAFLARSETRESVSCIFTWYVRGLVCLCVYNNSVCYPCVYHTYIRCLLLAHSCTLSRSYSPMSSSHASTSRTKRAIVTLPVMPIPLGPRCSQSAGASTMSLSTAASLHTQQVTADQHWYPSARAAGCTEALEMHESGSRTTVPVDGVERLVCPHARLLDTVEEGVTR